MEIIGMYDMTIHHLSDFLISMGGRNTKMKHIIKYIVGRSTIAVKDVETGAITRYPRVEELKNMFFAEGDFVQAEDGSNPYIETDLDGNAVKVQYVYYKKDLIECPSDFYATRYFKKEQNAFSYGYRKCYNCGKWHDGNRRFSTNINGGERIWFCSENCANNSGFFLCGACGSIFHKKYMVDSPIPVANNRLICTSCFNHKIVECDNCHNLLFKDSIHTHELYDYVLQKNLYYCNNCIDKAAKRLEDYEIASYHDAKSHHKWTFKTAHGEPLETFTGKYSAYFYLGAELEVEAYNCEPEIVTFKARQMLNKTPAGTLAFFEHDGSLDDGVEIIFNPMTIKYLYQEENLLKNAFNELQACARSHDTHTCGLHVHYSKQCFDTSAICRLVYLFQKYKREIESIARRKSCHYAEFYSDTYTLDTIRNIIDYDDRYRAVNLTNQDTIEVRIFKGTLKFETFMATLEFVNNIMHVALILEDDEINTVSFADIIDYIPTRYLKDYAAAKHLYEKKGDDM